MGMFDWHAIRGDRQRHHERTRLLVELGHALLIMHCTRQLQLQLVAIRSAHRRAQVKMLRCEVELDVASTLQLRQQHAHAQASALRDTAVLWGEHPTLSKVLYFSLPGF